MAGTIGAFMPSASAAISSVGPIDPGSLFPSYYADANGLALEMCQAGLPNCLAGPELMQDVHAAGGDAEAFYFHASVENVGGFLVETALEAAYLADGPDQEVTFQRRQAGAKGVTPNGKYTITDPYGTYTCTADATGLVQPAKGCRFETTPVPGNFNAALGGPNGPIGPFLTWDTFGTTGAGAPPAGYIGDNATPHVVVGSPTGFNKMRVSGPGITGTCTNDDGSTVDNCQETDKIVLQGKTVDTGVPTAQLSTGTLDYGDIPATPAVTRTLTYANTGSLPVNISSVGVTGTGAAAFGVTNNCPATVAVGTRCTIDVKFTPESGKASAATLTVADDTAIGTRTVALKGSNLGVMYVADPVPPAGLNFGTVGVGATSLEDNVVIGNSGNGPLTVASATITGASSAQYKLGPNDACVRPGVTVIPDGGCEIGVQFVPTSTGSKSANLRVTDSNGAVVNVPLTGTGSTQTVPGAPTIGTATAGNASATVTWTAPTATGTSAISGYTVRAYAAGATTPTLTAPAGSAARTLNVTGLTNGTSYTFDVVATNTSGPGQPSAKSNAVTPNPPPATAPAQPAAPTATPADSSATVRWTAPATGGSAITGYTVRTFNSATGAAVGTPVTVGGTVLNTTVTGLTNGTAYRFTVAATNAVGTSAQSALSAAVTPAATVTAPAQPAAPTATAGNASATVAWTAPATGGSPITGYTVRTFNSATGALVGTPATVGGTVLNTTVTGLTNGTAYRFTVAATNAAGTSAQSAQSAAVTPVTTVTAPAQPAAPTATAGSASATVSWTAPANGGSAITGYTVRTFNSATGALVGTPLTVGNVLTANVTGLTNGTAYRFTVAATNAVGTSAQSAQSLAVTPQATVNAAPTVTGRTPAMNATAVAGATNITVTFSEAVTGVSTSTAVLKGPLGGVIATTVRQGTGANQWIIDPTPTLAGGQKFTLTLTGGSTAIRDLSGLGLVGTASSPLSWSFTTA